LLEEQAARSATFGDAASAAVARATMARPHSNSIPARQPFMNRGIFILPSPLFEVLLGLKQQMMVADLLGVGERIE